MVGMAKVMKCLPRALVVSRNSSDLNLVSYVFTNAIIWQFECALQACFLQVQPYFVHGKKGIFPIGKNVA